MSHYHQYRQQPFSPPSFPVYQQEGPNYFNPLKEENQRRYNNDYHYYHDDNDLGPYNNHYCHHYETDNMPAIGRKSFFDDNHYYYDIPKLQQNKQNYNKIHRRNIRSRDNNKNRSEDIDISYKYNNNLELFTDSTTARGEPHYFYFQQQDEVPPQLLHYQRLNGVRSVSPFHSTTNANNSNKNRRKSQQEKDYAFRREMNRNPNQSWVQQPNNALSFIAHLPPMMHNPMIQNYGLGVSVTSENWLPLQPQSNNSNNEILFMPQPMIPIIQPSSYIMPDYNNLLHLHGPSLPIMQYPPFPPNNSNNSMLFANLLQHDQHLASARFSQQTPENNNNNNNVTTTANSIIDPGSGFSNEEERRSATPSSHSVKSEPRSHNSGDSPPKTAAGLKSDLTILHQPQHQQLIKRRRSLMENILSSFSLLGEPENYTVPASDNNAKLVQNNTGYIDSNNIITKESSDSSTSKNSHNDNDNKDIPLINSSSITDTAEVIKQNNSSSLRRRKSSLKIYQKVSALQNRDYIWCFRPLKKKEISNEDSNNNNNFSNISEDNEKKEKWVAFDVENQNMLDLQYSIILSKKNNTQYGPKNEYISILQKAQQESIIAHKPDVVTTDDPSLIFALNRQSNLPSPVMVSVQDRIAWYSSSIQQLSPGNNTTKDDLTLLEIACMPTRLNKLVLSNDSIEKEENPSSTTNNSNTKLKRSKSMDGITSKLLNTILRW